MKTVSTTSLRLDTDLVAHAFALAGTEKASKPPPTHHVAVIDCSGSMGGELPNVRKQLSEKLPTMLDPGDFFSLVWFSGRGEAGVVLDHVSVKSVKDIDKLQKTLEKWLRPIGLTGFYEPAQLAEKLFLADAGKNVRKSLLFLSDGCENQTSEDRVLDAFKKLAAVVDAATVVEYGYYADRALLGRLATMDGGSLVLSKDFGDYEIVFERTLRGGPKEKFVEVQLATDPVDFIVYGLDSNSADVRIFEVDGNRCVKLPEGYCFSFLSKHERGSNPSGGADERAWQVDLHLGLAVFGHRMRGKIVRQLLMKTRNLEMANLFGRCFGKQRYGEFVERAKATAVAKLRSADNSYPTGDVVFEKNALTIPELLGMLVQDACARFLPDHPMLQYARMSRPRQDVSPNKLAFIRHSGEDGVPFLGLTWNEERANISALVTYLGTVDLSGILPVALKGKIPAIYPTKIYRNYNFVRDGIVHIDLLPILASGATLDAIRARNKDVVRQYKLREADGLFFAVLDLTKLAVTNWEAAESVSAKEFFLREYALHRARSRQKVFKAMLDEQDSQARAEARSEGVAKVYDEESAKWLREIGITDNGFAPKKTIQADSLDSYTGQALQVSMKGMSSLPSWKEFKAAFAKGSSTPRIHEMTQAYNTGRVASVEGLKKLLEASIAETRKLIAEQAKTRFTILTGQTWFKEFSTAGEGSLALTKEDGLPFEVAFTAKIADVSIDI